MLEYVTRVHYIPAAAVREDEDKSLGRGPLKSENCVCNQKFH
jgi:hypothetical protein